MYGLSMRKGINIARGQCRGRYDDVLDVVDALSQKFGNGTIALAMMVRESSLYRAEQRKLNGKSKRRKP